MSVPLTPEQSLEHWHMVLISDSEYRLKYDRIGTPAQRDDELSILDRIKHFRAAVNAGIYPDTRTLCFVAQCFGRYELGGGVSLDSAFGLRSLQRVGNPAKRAASDDERDRRCYEMHEYIERNPNAAQLQAAEAVQQMLDIEFPDCETMVRDYSNWRRYRESPASDGETDFQSGE